MNLFRKTTVATLISLLPLTTLASTKEVEKCDTTLWSKASPNKALVIRHMDHGNTAFLTCTGHLDEKKQRYVMDTCKPIEPERQYYTEQELRDNWLYLIKRSAKDNLMPVLSDGAMAFAITELSVSLISQKLLAGGVATIGERIAANGPEAAKAVTSVGKALGGGSNLFEGSRAVANDAYLRFFPSYIGMGSGMAWAGVNMIKNGDLDRSMQRGSVMSPYGYRSYSCGPHELHKEFAVTGFAHIKIKNPTIDELEETYRSALKMSQSRPDSWAIAEQNRKELAKSPAQRNAEQSPPELAPTIGSAAK